MNPRPGDYKSGNCLFEKREQINRDKIKFTDEDINEIIYSLKTANRKKRYIDSVLRRLNDFAKAVNYECDFKDVVDFLEKIKKRYSYSGYHKYVLDVRRLLKSVNAPFADKIKLPKTPKRRKIIIRREDVQQIILNIQKYERNEERKLRAISAFLIAATSGIRAEELYKLTLNDIDLESRIIYIKFGDKAGSDKTVKDYEERITFFNEEAKEALLKYLEVYGCNNSVLFSENSLKRMFKTYPEIGKLRIKHMRKFFSQEWDRLGGPTSIKKMLMGHSISNDVDLAHYDFQDPEDLREIYDRVGIRIF